MPVDDNKIIALKQRRAIFEGHGQTEKVKAVDVEIARLRGELPPDPAKRADPEPTPEPAPVVEVAVADLSDVETAELPRRRGRPPKARFD